MLGTYVTSHLVEKGYDVVGLTRKEIDAGDVNVQIRSILASYGAQDGDVVINCIGTIKPQVDKLGTLNDVYVNTVFPRILANVCESIGASLIHITTDCVRFLLL